LSQVSNARPACPSIDGPDCAREGIAFSRMKVLFAKTSPWSER
jgi:hypothetical protein